MENNNFQVPSGYEEFVTNADDLLRQFNEVGAPDRCNYFIYFDTNVTIGTALELRIRIIAYSITLSRNYLWHKQSFNLSVSVQETSGLVFLSGCTEYSENVEDEWFIVYLLINISRKFPSVNIAVSDSSDGQFLLIEAADHLDDWISPENTENRVWIRNGSIYVIPLDEPGRLKSGGMPLIKALEFLNINHIVDNSQNDEQRKKQLLKAKISKNTFNSIAARSISVYPARIKALEHKVVCVMPKWAAIVFTQYPQLLSQSVSAFYTSDSFGQQAKVIRAKKDTSLPTLPSSVVKNNNDAAIIVLTLTRALFAQLTFKPNFKPPRQYHALMRRVTSAGSIKVRKAFDIGCRLVCGLEELCVSSAQVAIAANACVEETQQSSLKEFQSLLFAIEGKMNEDEATLLSLYNNKLLTLQYDVGGELDEGIEELQQMNHVQSLFQLTTNQSNNSVNTQYIHEVVNNTVSNLNSFTSGSIPNILTMSDYEEDSVDSSRLDREFFSVIANDSIKSDSDAWLYMSPEEMDKEMTNRMNMFTVTSDEIETASEVIETEVSTAMEIDLTNINSETKKVDDSSKMQDIVDGVKKFMKGKSGFDGIGGGVKTIRPPIDMASSSSSSNRNIDNINSNDSNSKGSLAVDGNFLQQLLSKNAQAKEANSLQATATKSKPTTNKTANNSRNTGITMEQIDFHYNEELKDLHKYFSAEDLEQFSDDSNANSDVDDGDDYSGIDSDGEQQSDIDEKDAKLFANPTTVSGIAKYTFNSKNQSGETESESEPDSDDETEANIVNRKKAVSKASKGRKLSKNIDEEYDFMNDYQEMMDEELFGQTAMSGTFERKPIPEGSEQEGRLGEVDVELNLLKNLLESHSQSLGMPTGPASQLLSQFGIQMPRPPPMNSSNDREKKKSSNK